MCDMEVFKNVSLYSHNFGTCNFKEFEKHNYPADIIRSCGPNPKSCSKDCKYYVDKMNNHRCMKGWEKRIHDTLMLSKSNKTAAAVWNATRVCAKSIASAGLMIKPQAMLIYFLFLCFTWYF